MKSFLSCLAALLFLFFISCNDGGPGNDTEPGPPVIPLISYSITGTAPHDTSYFTEGLEFHNGQILESTGNYGKSRLARYDATTGKPVKEIQLDNRFFGEGLTVFRDTLYQLTWKENVVLIYTVDDFSKVKELPLQGQGWGLTHDSTRLIASNGSSDLYFYEPSTFKLLNTLTVRENGSFVPNINELEYVNGVVYANQWNSNYIFRIDVSSGEVTGKMDLSSIYKSEKATNPAANEMNGIAYNPATGLFHITGKNWSQVYLLQFPH
ncbi:MAG: glutaminyl-peptide cyclotransferase [Flavisolibacter sp.]